MENKKYDLEKAKEDCRRHEDALEEAQSCMCGHCHECGFDPSEMKAALDEVERLRSLENCVSLVIDRQGKTNAALLGQLDVISAYLDAELVEWKNGDQIAEIAIKFMDLQKQKLNDANSQITAKDARIDLLDSDQKRYHAAWMAAEEDKEEQAARIKELEALNKSLMENGQHMTKKANGCEFMMMMDWTYLIGKRVVVGVHNTEIGGICMGITPDGWMIINLEEQKWFVKLDKISYYREK